MVSQKHAHRTHSQEEKAVSAEAERKDSTVAAPAADMPPTDKTLWRRQAKLEPCGLGPGIRTHRSSHDGRRAPSAAFNINIWIERFRYLQRKGRRLAILTWS